MMTTHLEKLTFGTFTGGASVISAIGAILTEGDARWLCITAFISFLTSGFLSLMFKKVDETIQIVVGRAGIAILGGMFATRPVVHWFNLESVYTDAIYLAGVSAGVCVLMFFVGIQLIKVLEVSAPSLAKKIFKRYSDWPSQD